MKLNRARHLLVITIIVVCIAYFLSACDSNVSGANLSEVRLRGADLTDANLSGAYLYKAKLIKANLNGAVWNDETVFPEGFEILDKLRG